MKCTGSKRILFPATDWNYKRYFKNIGDMVFAQWER